MNFGWMFADIEREIELYKLGDKSPLKNKGGGNYLCAIGLLSYTESIGKFFFKHTKASQNFNEILYRMGKEYEEFDKKLNDQGSSVYDTFRCGLVHEYRIKKDLYGCGMNLPEELSIGIGELSGIYLIIIPTYLNDLKKVVNILSYGPNSITSAFTI